MQIITSVLCKASVLKIEPLTYILNANELLGRPLFGQN